MGSSSKYSADTHGGWRNHYARMRRWHERCIETLSNETDKTKHDGLDNALAYFVWSHSLIDWLAHDESILKRDLTARIKEELPDWNIIRDIANRSRHLDLRRDPEDKYWTAMRMYYSYETASGGNPNARWVIWHKDKIYEMGNLIWLSSNMWDKIIKDLGLNISIEFDEWKQPT